MTKRILSLVLAAGAAFGLAGCAGPQSLAVKEMGSAQVGGRTATLSGLPEREMVYSPGSPPVKLNPNGEFSVEQMYTRYTLLADPKGKVPLQLWHGGGLAGTTFETKPDGQPGWEMFFLRAGWDVYVSDAVERGRASWARYPEIFTSEPVFRTKKEAWELFRIGSQYSADPAQRVALKGTQFPVQSFEQFTKQSIPRWATNDAAIQAAYDVYVEKYCPCVIVVHSQGGNFAFNSALKYPDKAKAIVAVETSGAPDPAKVDMARLRNVPMLWVWGDYIDEQPFWRAVVAKQEAFRTALVNAGGRGEVLALPSQGIRGNSHMLMMDRNSDQVAGLIQQWLNKQGLVK
jgi:pimeloyl-ACP methyl ester carboxylesterase